MPSRLNQLLIESGSTPLDPATADKFTAFLELLQKWNARTNLTAIRDEEGILSRHFVESILCAQNLPSDISSLLDFGSGAGFPGIPIALIKQDLQVTLAESQNKKTTFVREAVRTLDLKNTTVHSGRAEDLTTRFSCITLRAVDQMDKAIPAAANLLHPKGHLAIMTTSSDETQIQSYVSNFTWQSIPLQQDTNRTLLLGHSKMSHV